jgi:hypothetical protein
MANFKTGYQFAEDMVEVDTDKYYFTMLMQYFPTRESVPVGKSIAHGTNQCAFIHFLRGVNIFDIATFVQHDFSDISDFDSYGSLVISAQGCSNSGPGESLYISGLTLKEQFYDYILSSTITAFRQFYVGSNVTEYFVGGPKWLLRHAETKGFDVRNNATITTESIIKSTKERPTKLTNLLYFS